MENILTLSKHSPLNGLSRGVELSEHGWADRTKMFFFFCLYLFVLFCYIKFSVELMLLLPFQGMNGD